ASSSTEIVPTYEGRVALDVDVSSGRADLQLFFTTLADSGVYECYVHILGDDKGKLVDKARLVVRVPPSVPACAIQGKVECGQNINLTCRSEEGSPPPTYTWEAHDAQNVPRNKGATVKDGILSLYNISEETSGNYICTAANELSSAQCSLSLKVTSSSESLLPTWAIVLIIAFATVVRIVVIAAYCYYRQKR
uniref:Ig-like domain-containing protein n=2 Tax=Tetraodon nigroviridis TaxID=99883 RepID=H3DQX3_TETNG